MRVPQNKHSFIEDESKDTGIFANDGRAVLFNKAISHMFRDSSYQDLLFSDLLNNSYAF
jgi:hypothetical protein